MVGKLRASAAAVVLVSALGCALLVATPAGADGGVLGGCSQTLGHPFQPWLDPASYTLVPDGGFEGDGAGWQLSGGARTVSGNEPWYTSGPGTTALSLPTGSSAVSPSFCIGLLDPTVRLFARNSALLGLGTVVVTADVDAAGTNLTLPVGVIVAGSRWQPSLPLPLLASALSPLGDGEGTATARLHFTALGGNWQLDDVYVDPFKTS
jgi:hypothetical protein